MISLAAAPFMPDAARRVQDQLGLDYPYQPNGSGGPPLADLAAWGGGQAGGKIGTPEILFPRVENETA